MKALALLLLCSALCSASAQTVTNGNFRAAKRTATPAAEARPVASNGEKRKTYPFHGEVDSVDPSRSALRLRGKTHTREILVTKETRFRGSAENLAQIKPGERVSGSVARNAQGKEEARTIRVGDPKSRE